MDASKTKSKRRTRRKIRVRKRIFGLPERPRLTVFRSLKNIYAQIIDDTESKTLASASTQDKELAGDVSYGGNKKAAAVVGATLAERAKAKGIVRVSFDRNGFKYHGRVKELADAARKGGLEF